MVQRHRKAILILSSVLVFPVMSVVFLMAIELLGVRNGYFAGFAVYWAYCLGIVLLLGISRRDLINGVLRPLPRTKRSLLYAVFAAIPIAGVFYIQFLPHMYVLDLTILMMASGNALVNGTVEELYWRGMYLAEFGDSTLIGLWFSTVLFGVWHIALYLIRDIAFGGFWPLVGGAASMGLLWGFCSRKLGSIMPVTIAHIFVNIFAFAGLYLENGFWR